MVFSLKKNVQKNVKKLYAGGKICPPPFLLNEMCVKMEVLG